MSEVSVLQSPVGPYSRSISEALVLLSSSDPHPRSVSEVSALQSSVGPRSRLVRKCTQHWDPFLLKAWLESDSQRDLRFLLTSGPLAMMSGLDGVRVMRRPGVVLVVGQLKTSNVG